MIRSNAYSMGDVRPGIPMATDAITRDLARAAHALWCRKMVACGWTYGEVFDQEQCTHDALVPFDRLNIHDQNNAIVLIQSEEIEERLARLLDYPRGPDRPFTPEEMRVGLPVGWATSVKFTDPLRNAADEVGTVMSWQVDEATGELSVIRIRWPGGDVNEHYPSQRDLRRLS